MVRMFSMLTCVATLSACVVPAGTGPTRSAQLPEAVLALVAPGQDVTTARLNPEDNCYWYDYAGPVETTPVPLRSVQGGQLCTERAA